MTWSRSSALMGLGLAAAFLIMPVEAAAPGRSPALLAHEAGASLVEQVHGRHFRCRSGPYVNRAGKKRSGLHWHRITRTGIACPPPAAKEKAAKAEPKAAAPKSETSGKAKAKK